MKINGFYISCLLSICIAYVAEGTLFKLPFPEPKPGGILDVLKKPKLPLINVHISKGQGAGVSIGSFGFGFGFGGQYVPPGTRVNLPPKVPDDGYVPDRKPDYPDYPDRKPDYPDYPDRKPDYPDRKPDYPDYPDRKPDYPDRKPDYPDRKPDYPDRKPDYPDRRPDYPDRKPEYPDRKPDYPEMKPVTDDQTPHRPGIPWEKENGEKEWSRPSWGEDAEEKPKRGSYGDDEGKYPKRDSYEEGIKKDTVPAWEDIGEAGQDDPDSKSENFMERELVNDGFIQPRQNMRRSKRFVESHVYHVPLMFRSNAKPFQVKVQSNHNSLSKGGLRK